jgi:hypothetical protein
MSNSATNLGKLRKSQNLSEKEFFEIIGWNWFSYFPRDECYKTFGAKKTPPNFSGNPQNSEIKNPQNSEIKNPQTILEGVRSVSSKG